MQPPLNKNLRNLRKQLLNGAKIIYAFQLRNLKYNHQMSKIELTLKQKLAVLVVNYQEIKTIFQELPAAKHIKDDAERRGRVLADLEAILSKGFKTDPNCDLIYSIFEKK